MAQPGEGLLRVVGPDELAEIEQQEAEQAAESQDLPPVPGLLSFLDRQWRIMRNYRSSEGINERLLNANRSYRGVYDVADLVEIEKFGGSKVYSQTVSTKCRGISAMLGEIYLGPERPWAVQPTPMPDLPGNVYNSVTELVRAEVATLVEAGQPVTDEMVEARRQQLLEQAQRAARRTAKDEAEEQTTFIDDYLVEGGFYTALQEFLTDLPIYPYAVLKGPEIHMVDDVRWGDDGQAIKVQTPKFFWRRVSPFDFYWTPGAGDIGLANVIERHRLMRADIQALIGMPGYDDDALYQILQNSEGVYTRWWDETDSERARQEDKEQPPRNDSDMIDMLEYQGTARGDHLSAWGVSVPDDRLDYNVTLYRIAQHIIKATINPHPRTRHNYFSTCFQKMPGSAIGLSVPDLIRDIEKVCNASLRSLVNNLSIASGPQVVIDDTRFVEGEDRDSLYPWRRWHYQSNPYQTDSRQSPPVEFFQPTSNVADLLTTYERFSRIADENSAFPRYMTGDERVGGAGRTASGLAMVMNNANTVLQQVARNIDSDVLDRALNGFHDMIMMLALNPTFRGDENVRVLGVAVAAQKETMRMRQLEFLQLTANPIDMQIMGLEGRAKVLSKAADNIGFDGAEIVPDPQDVAARLEQPQSPEQQLLAQGQEGNVAQQLPAPGSNPNRGMPRENAVPNRSGG